MATYYDWDMRPISTEEYNYQTVLMELRACTINWTTDDHPDVVPRGNWMNARGPNTHPFWGYKDWGEEDKYMLEWFREDLDKFYAEDNVHNDWGDSFPNLSRKEFNDYCLL